MNYQVKIDSPYTHYNFRHRVMETTHYVVAKSVSEEINRQISNIEDTLSISKESLIKYYNMKRD